MAKMKVFGPFPYQPHAQYAMTDDIALVIASYTMDTPLVGDYDFEVSNPASNDNVRLAALWHGLEDVLDDLSYAEIVSKYPDVRVALLASGFDCYLDVSVVENHEPVQFVPLKGLYGN